MQTLETETGLGYFKDQADHVIAKADLPPGRHLLKDGFIFVEVSNRDELDQVEIYRDPAEIQKQGDRTLIAAKMRLIAIAQLIAEGKLPPDFEDKAI